MSHGHRHIRLKAQLDGLETIEELPASVDDQGRVELLSSPISIMGVAAGDVIEVDHDGNFEVIERGGTVAVQVFLEKPIGTEREWFKRETAKINAALDSIRDNSFVVNVSQSVGHHGVSELMARFEMAYPDSFWQYGNVFAEATGEPLPWAIAYLKR